MLTSGCVTTQKPKPINYIAVEKPIGPIGAIKHGSIEKKSKRGGWYIGNHNFRPAPDVVSYLRETSEEANSNILKNTDVCLKVPFAFDILFFGYNATTDITTADGN